MPKFKVGDKIALAKVEYRTVLEVVQASDSGYLIKRPYRPFESSILSHSVIDIDNNYELIGAVNEHAAALAESQKRVAELEAEVESLKSGANPRSMRMNNRSLRMK